MELRRFVVLVRPNQDTQTAHRDPLLHTEELELITVLPALQRQRVPRHLHNRVLPQSRPLLVQQGVSLAQRGVTGQTGPYGHRWRLYAVVTVDRWGWFCCPVSGEVLYFGLKAGVYLQSEIRGEEYLTLWTEERTLLRPLCFPHSLDAGETEVMSTRQRHRICEDILADGTLQSFLNSPHSSACTCCGSSVCSVLLAFLLMNVSQASLGSHTPLMCLSVRLLKMRWNLPLADSGHWLSGDHIQLNGTFPTNWITCIKLPLVCSHCSGI